MSNMNNKGVELSMNVIIIAAISLLVLVILAVLVINSGGKVQQGTQCLSQGGICKVDSCSNSETEISGTGLCPESQSCCSKFTP